MTPQLTTKRAKELLLWLNGNHTIEEHVHYHQLLEIARAALHDVVTLHKQGHGVWSEEDATEDFYGLRSQDKENN